MVNDYIYKTNLIGDFNIYNCLIGIIIGNLYNIDNIKINNFYNEFKYVDGRMNKYIYKKKNIIIDYAHTYSSIVEVIDYILKITENPYIVLGLGGNREKEKREMVGKYLNTIKANIILTSDNPRYEEPIDIINQIKKYIDKEVIEIVDRKKAIIYALDNMKENEYLVILGKGNEEYIEIKGNKYKYSDIEVIYEYFKWL